MIELTNSGLPSHEGSGLKYGHPPFNLPQASSPLA